MDNTFYYDLNNGKLLREVIVKIGLERIRIQKGVTVKALLDSGAMRVVMPRLKMVDLIYFIFSFHFYFLLLEQLGLGLIGYTVTSVTI